MGTRPAAPFRMVSSLSVAVVKPFDVWMGAGRYYISDIYVDLCVMKCAITDFYLLLAKRAK